MSEWSKLPYERRAYVLQHLEDEARLFERAASQHSLAVADTAYPEKWRSQKEQMAATAHERAHDMAAARQVLVLEGGKEIEDEAPTSQPA